MNLLIVIVLSLAAFTLVATLAIFYFQRVVGAALTDPFRAAETIVNGGVPPKWLAQINRRLAWRRMILPKRIEPGGTTLLLYKMDQLQRFFENSTFYESVEARQLLLSRLEAARQRWSELTWDELQAISGSENAAVGQPESTHADTNASGGI